MIRRWVWLLASILFATTAVVGVATVAAQATEEVFLIHTWPTSNTYCSGGATCAIVDSTRIEQDTFVPDHSSNQYGGIYELDRSMVPADFQIYRGSATATQSGIYGWRMTIISWTVSPLNDGNLQYGTVTGYSGDDLLYLRGTLDQQAYRASPFTICVAFGVADATVNFDGQCDKLARYNGPTDVPSWADDDAIGVAFAKYSATNLSHHIVVQDFAWVAFGVAPHDPYGDLIGGLCMFTTTIPMTDENGITGTTTVSYTRQANLVANYSFEAPSSTAVGAAEWDTVVGGVGTYVPGYWQVDPPGAHLGSVYVTNPDDYELWQTTAIYTSGNYLVGFYADGPGASIKWGGSLVASSSSSIGYAPFTGTRTANTGGTQIIMDMSAGGGLGVDDVFVFPSDENGVPLACDPAYYAPYDENIDGGTGDVGGIPAPIEGAGTICYRCFPPSDASSLAVSYWIAWLGCVLRNMFSCSLRVWLLVLGNWTNGVIQILLAFATWVPLTTQQGANWFAGTIVPAIRSSINVTVYDNGTNIWDLLVAIINLIGGIVNLVASLMLRLFDLVGGTVLALREAFGSTAPEGMTFLGFDPANGLEPPLLSNGPSDLLRFYSFWIWLALVDQTVIANQYVSLILLLVTGAVGLSVIFWTLSWWQDAVIL